MAPIHLTRRAALALALSVPLAAGCFLPAFAPAGAAGAQTVPSSPPPDPSQYGQAPPAEAASSGGGQAQRHANFEKQVSCGNDCDTGRNRCESGCESSDNAGECRGQCSDDWERCKSKCSSDYPSD